MTKLTKEDILAKTNPNNIKELVLAAAQCVNACKHLIKDERSLKAIDAAMNFESYSEEELEKIINAANAVAAVHAAKAAAATAAWYAAAAVYAAEAAAYAAAAAWYAADAIYSAAKALKDDEVIESIIDKYLPI